MTSFAGWAAIAAAVLTVTGLATLLAFFASRRQALGDLNDLNAIALACATVPVALALHPVASRTSVGVATIALVADLAGVVLAAGFSGLLLARLATFDGTLGPVTIGNGAIGLWLALTAALLLAGSAVPTGIGWLGFVGGVGLAITSLAFPLLGRDHPVIALAGLASLIGLVGFYASAGVLMLEGRFAGT